MKRKNNHGHLRWLLPALVVATAACGSESAQVAPDVDAGAGGIATGGIGGGGTTGTGGTETGGAGGDGTGGTENGGSGGDGAGGTENGGTGGDGTGGTENGGTGGDGTGGTETGGTGGGGTGGDGTGGAGTGGTGTLGQSCSPTGAYSCAGHAQRGQLVCDGGVWVTNGTCPWGQNCDTRPTNAGFCAPIVTACEGKQPGDLFCEEMSVWRCGPDLVSTELVTPCTNQACVNGACVGVCAPATTQCSGNGVQTCSATGDWGLAVSCSGQACVGGACVGVCGPGTTQCAGNGVQTCSSTGQWGAAVTCDGQACINGSCAGTCAPGTKQCSGNGVQSCASSGQWSAPIACEGQACSNGMCIGVCTPETTRCSANGLQTCSPVGQWGDAVACVNQACVGNACTGVCAPGAQQCSGNGVQTCSATGSWGAAAACVNQACVGGVCSGECLPYSRKCLNNGVQTCSATGAWGGSQPCQSSACVGGVCQGTCVPGTTMCATWNGLYRCSLEGYWVSGTPCVDSVCVNGACVGECAPGQTQCVGHHVQSCTEDGAWGGTAECSWPTPACVGGECVTPPNCTWFGNRCGPSANDDCCASPLVSGGTFLRSYDGETYSDGSYPATVSDFRLDKYEVTVDRFEEFVKAWASDGWRPTAGDGRHSHLNAGNGLALPWGGFETGWVTAWNAYMPSDGAWVQKLQCSVDYQTWNNVDLGSLFKPINCVSWPEAYAFCIWDGGFLPSEAEWNYAAAGGNEQRPCPWGDTVPGPDATLAIHGCYYGGTGTCSNQLNIARVGFALAGIGKWGQADLAGNVAEWTLDRYQEYMNPCVDCVRPETGWGNDWTYRGGSFRSSAPALLSSRRYSWGARMDYTGFRCARRP